VPRSVVRGDGRRALSGSCWRTRMIKRKIMELLPYINPLISFTSLIIALYTFRRTYRLNQEVKLLNSRKILADQFKTYADLLQRKYEVLNESLSKLCGILCETNYQIGLLLDKHDDRDAKNYTGYVRYLRHLYVDLHEDILNNFKYELSGQTNQHLFWLLADVRKIIPEKDFIISRKGIL
jgi:hypothetical protein